MDSNGSGIVVAGSGPAGRVLRPEHVSPCGAEPAARCKTRSVPPFNPPSRTKPPVLLLFALLWFVLAAGVLSG